MHFAPWRSGADLTADAPSAVFLEVLPLAVTVARLRTRSGDAVQSVDVRLTEGWGWRP